MLPPSNPYNWQRINPDLFYGRTALANDLVRRLVNGESFGITGGRKMGKTTLLRRVEKDLLYSAIEAKKGGLLVIPIYIETLALPLNISADSIYQEIARLLNKKLRSTISITANSEQVDAQGFTSYLQTIVNSITRYRPQLIFIFDEIEPIITSDWGRGFFANWRSLLQNNLDLSHYLSAVFAGASEMFEIARDIGSPLSNILVWRELELFLQNDTAKLMCEPSQYDWSDIIINDVHKLTGGHPFLIQYMMQLVCSEDVEKASLTLDNAKRQFLKEQKIQFQNWWDRFNNTTQAIYAQLAEQNSLKRKTLLSGFGGSANRGIAILAHTGVVRIDWENDTILMAGSLFKEWFREFGTIEVTPTLADQVDSLLKEVERQLRQLLTTHFNKKNTSWLQNHFKTKPQKWKDILKKAKKSEDAVLNNQEVLKSTDLGDLFELILSEWGELSSNFTNLSSDKKRAKSRLEERKDHLVFVRNPLRHVNESDLSSHHLLKAQAFCLELLESLTRKT
ncbi:MAG: hypothetical protein RLZZ338_1749 [Cyanobacteriota bacterium]|jgi:hypothetical protein